MKSVAKVLTFLVLMCIFLLIAGSPGLRTLYGQKLMVIYGFGAAAALWFGGWSIGTLEPTSMRPVFIVLGAIVMIVVFVLMLGSRELMRQLDRGANPSAKGDIGVVLCNDVRHQWPGALRLGG